MRTPFVALASNRESKVSPPFPLVKSLTGSLKLWWPDRQTRLGSPLTAGPEVFLAGYGFRPSSRATTARRSLRGELRPFKARSSFVRYRGRQSSCEMNPSVTGLPTTTSPAPAGLIVWISPSTPT
jgi:hypothetical protein